MIEKKSQMTLAVLMVALGGCGQNLAYVHNAALGVDVTLGTDGTSHVSIGYDKDTYAIVPRDTSRNEAMTLISVSNIEVDGLNEVIFNHVVITGEAARRAANDKGGLRMMRAATGLGEVETK
jgi:hypothetical protein